MSAREITASLLATAATPLSDSASAIAATADALRINAEVPTEVTPSTLSTSATLISSFATAAVTRGLTGSVLDSLALAAGALLEVTAEPSALRVP